MHAVPGLQAVRRGGAASDPRKPNALSPSSAFILVETDVWRTSVGGIERRGSVHPCSGLCPQRLDGTEISRSERIRAAQGLEEVRRRVEEQEREYLRRRAQEKEEAQRRSAEEEFAHLDM